MPTTDMYEGAGHGAVFWAIYLACAAFSTIVLMLLMLRGVASGISVRADAPVLPDRAGQPGAVAPSSRARSAVQT